MTPNWYAVYTKPRWEKKVAETLNLLGITNYCPLNKVIRQWSDRKKIVYEPLFTSYVFVRITEKQQAELKKVNGVLCFVSWLGKPALIREEEIELIRQFLNRHEHVRVAKNQLSVNDHVKVNAGFFLNQEGTVVARKNHTVVVALPTLGYKLYAEVDEKNVEKISHTATASC